MNKFKPWLLQELKSRSWRRVDFAHRAGLSLASLSDVLNGIYRPGPEMCKAIAQALGTPPEKVFRLAGLLPPLPASEEELLNELLETFQRLTPEQRREALEYALWQLRRQQEEP